MELNLDSQTLDISCPGCGHKIKESIGRLKTNPKLTCPACSAVIDIDAKQLRAGIEEAQQALADFERKAREAFKRL